MTFAKRCKPNKALDSPAPGPSTDDPSYATSSSNDQRIALSPQ